MNSYPHYNAILTINPIYKMVSINNFCCALRAFFANCRVLSVLQIDKGLLNLRVNKVYILDQKFSYYTLNGPNC